MKKRFLSMLLAFAMVLTIAPVSASAEALDPGTSPDQSGLGAGGEKFEAVQVLPEPVTAPGIGSIYDIDLSNSDFSLWGLRPSVTFSEKYYNQLDQNSQAVYTALIDDNCALKSGPTTEPVTVTLADPIEVDSVTMTVDASKVNVTTDGNGQATEVKDTKPLLKSSFPSDSGIWTAISGVVDPAVFAVLYDEPKFSWLVNTERTMGLAGYTSTGLPQEFSTDEILAIWNNNSAHTKEYTGTVTIQSITFGMSEKGYKAATTEPANGETDFNTANTEDLAVITTAINNAKTAIDAELTATSTPYETVKAIHDWICKTVKYADKNGDKFKNNYRAYQTAYSALVSPYTTVCAGYAKSFKLLCDAYNIPCIVVSGTGGDTNNEKQPHAWNYVQLDGGWYAVDCTWDDQDTQTYYEYFLAGKNTPGFTQEDNTKPTFSETHTPIGTWYENLPYTFVYPELEAEKYVDTSSKEPLPGTFSFKVDGTVPTVDKANVGQTVTAMFNFNGSNGATSPEITYKWYRQTESGNTPLVSTGTNGAEYKVTGNDAGKTLLVYASAEDYKDCENPGRITIRTPLSDCTITLSDGNKTQFTYDTQPHKPTVVSVTTKDNQTLVEDRDYGVSYQMLETGPETEVWKALDTSGGANVGSYRVCITALNGTDVDGDNYSGEAYVQYEITKATPGLGTVTVMSPNPVYATTKLNDIELQSSNSQLPAGTLKLKDTTGTVGQSGEFDCTFVPDDSANYNSVDGKVSITVTARAVASITVETNPTKTEYQYGEKFDPAGLVLKVTYTDGDSATLNWTENSGITFSDLGGVDTTSVTVTYEGKTATIPVTVKAKDVNLGSIAWNISETGYIYNGEAQTVALKDGVLTDDITSIFDVTYTGNSATDANADGENYTAVATFTLKDNLVATNYNITGGVQTEDPKVWTISAAWTIGKKPVELTGVSWTVPKASIPYADREHTGATLTGTVPEELVVKTQTGDKGTNVGKYTPTVTFELKTGLKDSNYTLPTSLTVAGTQWEIIPGTMTGKNLTRNVKYDDTTTKEINLSEFGIMVSGVKADVGTVTPDNILAATPTVENGVLSYALKGGLSAPTEVTKVIIPVTFKAANYNNCEVTLTVNVVSKDVPDITVNDYTKTYNGSAVTMDDLKDRLTVTFEGTPVEGEWTTADTLPTNAGTYTCNLTFSPTDKDKYQDGLVRVIKITIDPLEITVKANDAEIVQDGTPTLGYTVTPALATGDTWTTEPEVATDSTKFGTVGTHTGAITVSGGFVSSDNDNYTITYQPGDLVVTPKIEGQVTLSANPASGTALPENGTVTLSSNPADATIYYTLDGTNPVVGTSPTYSTPIRLTGDTLTIKAIAVKAGMNDSTVATFTYTKQTPTQPPVVQQVATPVINPAGGGFYGSQQVTITCATPGATIYYSVDGAASQPYVGSFTLYNSATVTAYATFSGMTDSNPATAAFTRYTYTPDPTPDPDPDPEPDNNYEPPVSSNNNNSNNSSNSSNSSTTQPTTPTQPETPTVPEVTARPEATVDGGTASAAVPAETVEKLVEQAVSGKSGTLVIAPVIGGDVTKAEVTLPANAVTAIANATSASLRVETPVAEVTIPNDSLAGLGNQGAEIAVTAEKSEDGGVDVAVVVDGQRVENVPIKAAIPTPCGPGTVAKIVDANGNVISTVRKSSASGDGQTMNVPLDGSAKVVFVDSGKSFPDVPATNWAADAVAFASSHELMNGVNEETFSPSTPMTRGMLAVVLHNLEGNPDASYQGGFSDVTGSAWYAEAVQWASEKKVVTGLSDGVFAPDSPITREQLVVMLYRYMGEPAVSGSSLGRFSDSGTVSDWAAQAMSWAVANGVVNGSNGALNPQGSATRAEVAQMLMNFVSSGML